MRSRSMIGAACLFCLVCLVVATALAAEPDGAFPIHEDVSAIVSPDPGGQMSAARTAFIDVDLPTASDQIRKAARTLRDTAANATEGTRDALHKSAIELESLARRIEKRSVQSVAELDRACARAFHALARHDHETGQQHWRDRKPQQAGHRLRAAADNLERAAAATGQRLNEAGREVVRESRVVSGKLIRGTGYAADEVGKTFEGLGKQVESVGDRVATRSPAPIVVPN
jgi:hypothetical protein